jgi:hypothetical protein
MEILVVDYNLYRTIGRLLLDILVRGDRDTVLPGGFATGDGEDDALLDSEVVGVYAVELPSM